MDEQNRQPEAINEPKQPAVWDDTADGAAYRDYGSDEDYEEDYGDGYYDTDGNYNGDIPEPDPEDISYPNEPEPTRIEPDGARLAKDGNVEFGDNFFGDVRETAKEPEFYTDEELRNTPYEQWDTNRLDGDIRRFTPIVQEQIARRNAQARAQSLQNIPMPKRLYNELCK